MNIGLTRSLGNRSVRFEYDARRDGETVFAVTKQCVCLVMAEDNAMAISDPVREAMEPYIKD